MDFLNEIDAVYWCYHIKLSKKSVLNISKNKKTLSVSSVPDWFNKNVDESSVSTEEQQKFLEKLKEVRVVKMTCL